MTGNSMDEDEEAAGVMVGKVGRDCSDNCTFCGKDGVENVEVSGREENERSGQKDEAGTGDGTVDIDDKQVPQ